MTDNINQEDLSKVSGGSGDILKCPKCGSTDCITHRAKTETGFAYFNCCNACGCQWVETTEIKHDGGDPGIIKQPRIGD